MSRSKWRFSWGALLLLLACAMPAGAQTITQVSGTIVDPNGLPYSGATIAITLSNPSGGQPTVTPCPRSPCPVPIPSPIQTNSAGFFSVQLYANASILPGGTQWVLGITEPGVSPPFGFGPQSFTYTFTASGASMDLSSALSAIAPAMTPAFGGGGNCPGPPAAVIGDLLEKTSATKCGAAPIHDTGTVLNATEPFNVTANGPSGSAAVKFNSTNGVCYADGTNGNNANDGLSAGSAKADVDHCLISLPGGAAGSPIGQVGSGTVYFADSTPALASDPHAGVCIMGHGDPNYSAPGSATTCDGQWMTVAYPHPNAAPVTIVGLPQTFSANGHSARAYLKGGANSDNNHPGIWLSSYGGQTTIENAEIEGAGRGIVTGQCSDLTTTNNCAVDGVSYVNDNGGGSVASGLGPAWYTTGGSFNLYFSDIVGSGTPSGNSYGSFGYESMVFDGTNNTGVGIIFIDGFQFNGSGGLLAVQGTGGVPPSITVRDGLEEGDGSDTCTPVVWFTGGGSNNPQGYDNTSKVSQTLNADCGNQPVVENDLHEGQWLIVDGNTINNGVWGPANVIGGNANPLSGQTGPIAGPLLAGQTNEYRRAFQPYPVRAVNLVTPGTLTNETCAGGFSYTGGVAAPDGTNNAYAFTCGAAGGAGFFSPSETFGVGDWIFFGAWIRAPGGFYSTSAAILPGLSSGSFTANCFPEQHTGVNLYYASQPLLIPVWYGYYPGTFTGIEHVWSWVWEACLITAGSGTSTAVLSVQTNGGAGAPLQVYAPTIVQYPASLGISNEEMAWIAQTFSQYSDQASAGEYASLYEALKPPTGDFLGTFDLSAITASRVYTFPDHAGTVCLTTTCLGSVTSVFGRTGAVVAQTGDYTCAQVTGCQTSANLAFTNKNLASTVSITGGASSPTAIDSITLSALPASCGTNGCRIRVSYWYFISGGTYGACWATDGTNSWAASYGGTINNNFDYCNGSALSTSQYSSGATPTITIDAADNGNASVCVTQGGAPCNGGGALGLTVPADSAMQVEVIPSN